MRQNKNNQLSQGFTFFELMLVTCVVCILAVVGLYKIMSISVYAERAAMLQVLSLINSTLSSRVAEHILDEEKDELEALRHSNPIELLASPPINYLGSFQTPNLDGIKGGHWFYDDQVKILYYKVQHRKKFFTISPPHDLARFRLNLVFKDLNQDERYTKGIDTPQGLALVSIEPYRWILE